MRPAPARPKLAARPLAAAGVARGLKGVKVVGADLVEVSPPFDPSGGTAFLGVSLMFEMLCMIAERLAADAAKTGAAW